MEQLRISLLELGATELVQKLAGCQLDSEDLAELQKEVLKAQQLGCSTLLDEPTEQALLADYEAETARLWQQLEVVGLGEQHLSAEGLQALQQLAGVAAELELSHGTQGAMMAAWSTLVREDMQAERLQAQVQQQVGGLQAKLSQVAAGKQELDAVLTDITAQLDNKQAEIENTLNLRQVEYIQKTENYKKARHKLTKQLAERGLTPELEQHRLVAQHEANEAQAAELARLQDQLARYHDLPPSQLGAEVKLRQAQEQLSALTARVRSNMASLDTAEGFL